MQKKRGIDIYLWCPHHSSWFVQLLYQMFQQSPHQHYCPLWCGLQQANDPCICELYMSIWMHGNNQQQCTTEDTHTGRFIYKEHLYTCTFMELSNHPSGIWRDGIFFIMVPHRLVWVIQKYFFRLWLTFYISGEQKSISESPKHQTLSWRKHIFYKSKRLSARNRNLGTDSTKVLGKY